MYIMIKRFFLLCGFLGSVFLFPSTSLSDDVSDILVEPSVKINDVEKQSERKDAPGSKSSNGKVSIPPPLEGVPVGNYSAQPQNLEVEDLSILTSRGNVHVFKAEMALTKAQQATGMMFRDHIDEGTGMLFVFDNVAERSFWMKNTLIPLDIIFIRADGVIHNIHYMAEPKSLERLSSDGPVKAALEVAGGATEILGINIGDRVVHETFLQKNSEK